MKVYKFTLDLYNYHVSIFSYLQTGIGVRHHGVGFPQIPDRHVELGLDDGINNGHCLSFLLLLGKHTPARTRM